MANTVSTKISDETLSRIIQIESAGKPRAKAATSSATGLGQFLNATWLGMVKKYRPEWMRGRTQRQVLDMRLDPVKSIEMLARFTEENAAALGRGYTDGDLYLAHFLGTGQARKVLRAPQQDSVEGYVTPESVRANRSILQGKTCGQVRAWASRKMVSAGPPANRNWIDTYWPAAAAVAEAEAEDEGEAEEVKSAEVESAEETAELPAAFQPTSVHIEIVQRQLAQMRYWAGNVDGKWGTLIAGAVGSFKADRGLPGEAVIDEALLEGLTDALRDDWTRPIAKERAEATARDIAPRVEAVRQTIWSRLWAKIATIGAGVGGSFGALADNFNDFAENPVVSKIISSVGRVPWYVWLLGLAALVGIIWRSQRHAEASIVEAYRDGRLVAGEDQGLARQPARVK